MDIWALIPVKSLKDSKRRLAHLLPAEQRAILIHGLLQHELMVLEEIPAITQVLVISSDPAVWQLAREFNVLVEEEIESQGLNVAIARGTSTAAERGAQGVLILPVDLPFLAAADVTSIINIGLVETAARDPQAASVPTNGNEVVDPDDLKRVMAICTDEEGDGTNALFLIPPSDFSFHFGPGSFQRHLQEASERDMIICTVSRPGLHFDLDSEKDWQAYQQMISMPDF